MIIELVVLLGMVLLIRRYVMPPLRTAIRARQELVRRQLEESRLASQRLEQAEQAYREAMSEARTEAAKIRDQARAEAGLLKTELREQAEREVTLIKQRGDEQLERQREQIKRELSAELGRLVIERAERIVGQSLEDDARRRATVDQFIAEIEGMAGGASAVTERAVTVPAQQRAVPEPATTPEPKPADQAEQPPTPGEGAPGKSGGRGRRPSTRKT